MEPSVVTGLLAKRSLEARNVRHETECSPSPLRLLTFDKFVDSAPFNPDFDLQRTGKLDSIGLNCCGGPGESAWLLHGWNPPSGLRNRALRLNGLKYPSTLATNLWEFMLVPDCRQSAHNLFHASHAAFLNLRSMKDDENCVLLEAWTARKTQCRLLPRRAFLLQPVLLRAHTSARWRRS